MIRTTTLATAALLALLTLCAGACSNGDPETTVSSLPEDEFTHAISHVHIAGEERDPNETKERVLKVLAELRSGTPIGEVVQEWSDHKKTLPVEGWLGFMRIDEKDPFARAFQAIPIGGVSGAVQAEKGYHVFYRHTFEEGREIEARHRIPTYGIFIPYGDRAGVSRADAEPRAKEAWDRINSGELTFLEAAEQYGAVPPPRSDAFIGNVSELGQMKEIYAVVSQVGPGEVTPLGEALSAFVVARRGTYMRSHVRHILIQHLHVQDRPLSVSRMKADALALAKEALAELGGDTSKWGAVLRKYSDDTSTLALQGWIGAITNGDLSPELESALLATEPGKISTEIVESSRGYHILWRVN